MIASTATAGQSTVWLHQIADKRGPQFKGWPHWNAGRQPKFNLFLEPRKVLNANKNILCGKASSNNTPHSSNEESQPRRFSAGIMPAMPAKSEQKGNKGEDPYRLLETGRKVYLDELDVLTLLDPPSFMMPSDPNSYNQAAYLWKKLGDIPEERRHRLLDLLTPKHVGNMWEVASQIYELSNGPSLEPANVLLGVNSELFMKPVTWTGKAFNAPWPLSWFSDFQKAFFLARDGSVYGRVRTGSQLLGGMTRSILPLYFEVRDIRKVVATEELCNIALEYGDGQLHLHEVPDNFPKPAKHPWPFSDASFDYLRPVGPGVIVGQWWIEGIDLEQLPEKRLDFVLIRDS